MKKIIGISLLALGLCFNATAQDKAMEKQTRAQVQAERMAKELNLTPAQVEKKAAIDAETQEKYQEINKLRQEVMDMRAGLPQDATAEQREEVTNMMKELREKQMMVRNEANQKFESILTDEQKKKYKEMRTVQKPKAKMTPAPGK
ncbi:MAG: Spy/CpxP family protein refolding chaperone [Bacteroidota bacterium]